MEKMDWDVIAAKVRAVSIKEGKPVRLLADTSATLAFEPILEIATSGKIEMEPAQNEDMGR
ncbi:hypothetical protein L917_08037 [Phytophthora nicotianae]|uniref:Uncharacterized protein n=1 Tax=Phytophthora nicotianae TaxID=4792 RepID=W2L904_PHYNI|nr:hypothetical protein L917_08037 [Phytophthora nicotianae]